MPFWLDPYSPLVLALAFLLDLALGDPPTRLHPVGWVGSLIAWMERLAPRGSPGWELAYGSLAVVVAVEASVLAALAVLHLTAWLPLPASIVLQACALKASFSIRSLARAARKVQAALDRDDLPAARLALRALVSRPTSGLGVDGAASAAVESVAENASDSAIAPLFYFALAGLPGAFAYRAANTLDAMLGYHGPYEYLGKASARLDDLLNLVPARLTGLLIAGSAPFAGGSLPRALATMRGESGRTSSPNAGWPMSATAGALGLRLEKSEHYILGASLAAPRSADIERAVHLFHGCVGLALLLVALYVVLA
ncbi:MAG: cobalamin biosynthesis protein CobD [Chloroflexi bacterium]|nr:cobalamin biosynthesis protein CobD [Chloroflexota bacterium]